MRNINVIIFLIFIVFAGSSFGITLQELINIAKIYSPILNEEKTNIKINEVEIKQKKAERFGKINIFGSYNRYEDARILYPISTPISLTNIVGAENQFVIGANWTVPLFTGFKLKTNIEISSLNKSLSKIRYNLTKNQLIYNIKVAYLKILSQEKQLKALNNYKNSLEVLFKSVKKEVELGRKSKTQLLKIDYQIQKTYADISKLSSSITTLKTYIKSLIGKEDIDLSYLEDINTSSSIQIQKDINNLDTLKQFTIIENLAKKKANIKKSNKFPQIYFMASAQRNLGNGEYKDLWQVGIFLNYTIFDFGKTKNEHLKEMLQAKKVKYQKEKAKLQVIKNLSQAVNQIKEIESKINAYKKQLELASKIEKDEKIKYKNGKSGINDYLLAKSQKLIAESMYLQSLYEKQIAKSYLEYILEEFKDE